MPTVVTFDPVDLRIHEIDTGTDNTVLAIDIYNNWKNWLLSNPQNMGHPQAFRVVGGDERSPTNNLGSTFFLGGGWKLKPAEHSHKWTVEGNMFVDGGVGSIFVPTDGAFTVHTETVVTDLISGLNSLFTRLVGVETTAAGLVADIQELAAAVLIAFTYNEDTDTVVLQAWLQRNGNTTIPVSMTFVLRTIGGTIVFSITDGDATVDAQGVYSATVAPVILERHTTYYATVAITDADGAVSTVKGIYTT